MRRLICLISLLIPLVLFNDISIIAEDAIDVPVQLQAALFLKVLPFNKAFTNKQLNFYIAGPADFAIELQQYKGKDIGLTYKIQSIKDGFGLPEEKPDVIYVADSILCNDIISYARKNKILTITGIQGLVKKGVSLGLGSVESKPKFFINLKASKEEGITWEEQFLKIAEAINY